MLIAHSLPVELSIAKKAGARIVPMAALRLLSALCYGIVLNLICRLTGLWQEPVQMFFSGSPGEQELIANGQSLKFSTLALYFLLFSVY